MKLVRDGYKDILPGNKLSYLLPDDTERVNKYLSMKLMEEVTEFIETDLTDVEELADIMEVIACIMEHKDLDADDLLRIASEKNLEKGSFHDLLIYDNIEPIENTNDSSENNGGSTDYYKLPQGAKDLQDLIEAKNMNFSQGNIFKAMYRSGVDHHSTYERDLNKIIFFAKRELKRIKGTR